MNANREARTYQGEEGGRCKGNMAGTGKNGTGKRRMGRPGTEAGMCVCVGGGSVNAAKGLDMI